MLALITTLMIVFVVKYHASRHPVPEQIPGKPLLEVAWTIIPTIIVLAMFWYGYDGFTMLRSVPEGAMNVRVTARMWDWSFQYESGRRSDVLYVPVGRPVKLTLNSLDVIHSFYAPAFRLKEDVVPGRNNYVWFKAESPGPAEVFCAEYCGDRHSYMRSQIIALNEQEFQTWYDSPESESTTGLDERDAIAVMTRLACTSCHGVEGRGGRQAPRLAGLHGTQVVVKNARGDEWTVTADDDYIARSITNPGTEVVKGFPDIMPAPSGLQDFELKLITDYLRGLK